MRIEIAANFMAEGIFESLDFWLSEMGLQGEIHFAPFDQTIQQLLDPAARLARKPNFSVILLDLSRWAGADESRLLHNVQALLDGAQAAADRPDAGETVIVLCPAPPSRPCGLLAAAEESLRTFVSNVPNFELVGETELQALYPPKERHGWFDAYTDELAAIPYSRMGLAALGTLIARKLYARRSEPRKAIVVDCDDTLWVGTCADAGPCGVAVTEGRKTLQNFLIEQHKNGRLICIGSKNDEGDVLAVFDSNPEMLLRREHITAWMVNWGAKSANVRELALRLNLGLDSLIFLDDSTFEVAAMQAMCPDVLALQLPCEDGEIGSFLRSVWDFDSGLPTAEDRARAKFYGTDAERDRARREAPSMAQFLASLELRVQIGRLASGDIARASQLSLRTNQFNLNGRRLNESELRSLVRERACRCLMVRVTDRFGDYGAVGVVIASLNPGCVTVNHLFLSCRALGRGVEAHLFAALAELASDVGAPRLEFAYRDTGRNHLIRRSLEEWGAIPGDPCWTLEPEPRLASRETRNREAYLEG